MSGAEAARVHAGPLMAHDAYTRLLHRLEPDAATLWQKEQDLVMPRSGVLVLDNTTLDKPYIQQMGQVVDLLTLLWNDGQASPYVLLPLRQSHGRADQNDHFQYLLRAAQQRGFAPRCVLFDSWYASLANLKQVRLRLALAYTPQAQPLDEPGWVGAQAPVRLSQ